MYSTEQQCKINELIETLGFTFDDLPIGELIDISKHKIQLMSADGNWNNVIGIIRKPDSIKYNVIVGNTILETSGEHKLKVDTDEFIQVKDIDTDKNLIHYMNDWQNCIIEKTSDTIPIIDFLLDNDHTYLSNHILSHNTSFGDKYCVDPFTTKVKIRYKV